MTCVCRFEEQARIVPVTQYVSGEGKAYCFMIITHINFISEKKVTNRLRLVKKVGQKGPQTGKVVFLMNLQ
jgi:hypothetical protein